MMVGNGLGRRIVVTLPRHPNVRVSGTTDWCWLERMMNSCYRRH
jgi:hypothetical protein